MSVKNLPDTEFNKKWDWYNWKIDPFVFHQGVIFKK